MKTERQKPAWMWTADEVAQVQSLVTAGSISPRPVDSCAYDLVVPRRPEQCGDCREFGVMKAASISGRTNTETERAS